MATGPGVVIGRKGSLGTAHYVDTDYWPHDTTLWVTDFKGNHPRFVYYFLRWLDVRHLNVGVSNPTLNRNHLYPTPVIWPDRGTQDRVVLALDAAQKKQESETRSLQATQQLFTAALASLMRAA
jgi:type I restriction enzyme S subunit